MMKTLEQQAKQLEQKIAAAASAGDKTKTTKLQRELNQVRNLLEQIKGSSSNLEKTLRSLDSATPKQLQQALKQLQTQLNGVQRGSAAWDAMRQKIMQVKEQIRLVNSQLATQRSMWSKLNSWFNNTQSAILAITAAVSGLVMAGRKAVNAFAGMEEQLANTQKYTRMTAKQVEELNQIFLKTDTRLTREQLNLLAQEGGRLGYNTVQKVHEYVNAASIINVALVDLGEGATQTIAKLSNIFGLEQKYGVQDAMLKIGSTVNHLSQNCTAAKPFLVEFAQRMAGVGSSARMSVPDILAFAATLDAHGQKVEMSATAIQRVIMQLYKKPAEMARMTGMNVKYFTKVLNDDATKGVMMFLEQLNKLGGEKAIAILSPMFKDLELNGVRVSSVITNLCSHLDFLKWQLGEARQAFQEGTSATNEYRIFNNTAQASIDKAKARVHELAIELGEKLYPVMKHIYTSSGVFLRVLKAMVEFFISNRTAITALVGALIVYNTVIAIHTARTTLATKAMTAFNAATMFGSKLLTGIKAVAGLAFAALANGVNYFTNGLQVNYAMQLRWQKAMAAMKFAHWTGLVVALGAAVYALVKNYHSYAAEMDKIVQKANDVEEATVKEMREMDRLVGTIEGSTEGSKQYEEAKQKLLEQYGPYLLGLINEKGEIMDLEAAYERLTMAIRRSNQERMINKARKELDDQFDKDFATEISKLRENLVRDGMPEREAANVTAYVMQQLLSGEEISEAYLRSIYDTEFGGWISSFGNFFRKLGGARPLSWLTGVTSEYDNIDNLKEIVSSYNRNSEALDVMHDTVAPNRKYSSNLLKRELEGLDKALEGYAQNGPNLPPNLPGITVPYITEGTAPYLGEDGFVIKWHRVSATEAQMRREEIIQELGMRGYQYKPVEEEQHPTPEGEFNPPGGGGNRSAGERFKKEKKWRKGKEAIALLNKLRGYVFKTGEDGKKGKVKYDEIDYEIEMADILVKFSEKILDRKDITFDEKMEAKADKAQGAAKKDELYTKRAIDRIKRRTQKKKQEALEEWEYGKIEKYMYEDRVRVADLEEAWDIYNFYSKKGKKEKEKKGIIHPETAKLIEEAKKEVDKIENKNLEETLTLNDARVQRINNIREEVLSNRANEKKYQAEIIELMHAHDWELEGLENSQLESIEYKNKRKLEIEKKYLEAVKELKKKYNMMEESTPSSWEKAIRTSIKWLESEAGQAVTKAYQIGVSGLSDIFSQATSLMQSELETQTAAIEKLYDAEISRAEGNAYLVAKLERKKEKEIAAAKQEANRKMFAMQVIQAVAQTATNALNAYGSAAAVPVVGYILAPIAAAMAVAAGAMQVAAIKKQQQASESQGYAEGGFTRPGGKYEPAGIVHAGEWVASQALVNNPATRPLIEALDYAQRTNTVGRLAPEDVSRSIAAPMVIASALSASAPASADSALAIVAARLADRLERPFVTVNTVQGDAGIRKALLRHQRLIDNKSPKR